MEIWGGERLSIPTAKSYSFQMFKRNNLERTEKGNGIEMLSIQIFRGNNWELTFEKSNGIDVLDSGYLIGRDLELVDSRLQKADKNHYSIKLNMDGKVYAVKDLSEDNYNMLLNGITTGNMPIDKIEDLIVLLM